MNILLCSTNDSVLKRWHKALATQHHLHQATSLETAYRLIARLELDLILLHRAMVDEKQIRELLSFRPGSRIFILADRPHNREGIFCLKSGCAGYSNTYIGAPRLALAVSTVLSGLIWTGTTLLHYLIEQAEKEPAAPDSGARQAELQSFANLSKREYQVAALVAEGLPNRQIAERLAITERTVKAHLSSVYAKTATSGRLGLAKALSSG